MIPEILDIQEQIGSDQELMEALEIIALLLPDLRCQAKGGAHARP